MSERALGGRAAEDNRPATGGLKARLTGLAFPWRLLLVALAGGVAAFAMPPWYALPVLWLSFTLFFWLTEGARTARGAFLLAWVFGTAYFAVGVSWVGHAFLVNAARHGAIMPFAVGGLAALLGLFPAFTFAALHWFRRWSGARGVASLLAFASAWMLSEWLREWIFTGFPWNPLGSAWSFDPVGLQLAAYGGVWLLGFLTVTAAAAPALLVGIPDKRRRRAALALALGLPALILAVGWLRLRGAPAPQAEEALVPDVQLRLVQPSIPQTKKWVPELKAGHVEGQLALSLGPGFEAATHVIWAEASIPYDLPAEPLLQTALAPAVPPGGALFVGSPRFEGSGRAERLYNSLYLVTDGGELRETYDKEHLVPFGEYLPLRPIFRSLGFERLAAGAFDFSSGQGQRTLEIPGAPPASPLVCYEVIFPGAATAAEGPRPGWIVNLTNDAWFGRSSGPHQHFAQARLRAVEEGLPVVRVANSGISAVVDGYGRVLGSLPLQAVGVLDLPLPKALPPTLFVRLTGLLGPGLAVAFILAGLAPAFWGRARRPKGSSGEARA